MFVLSILISWSLLQPIWRGGGSSKTETVHLVRTHVLIAFFQVSIRVTKLQHTCLQDCVEFMADLSVLQESNSDFGDAGDSFMCAHA